MPKENWKPVTQSQPCPICKRPNREHTSKWCLLAKDGGAAICHFVESERVVGQGFLHRLADPGHRRVYHQQPERPRPLISWDVLLRQFVPKNGELERAAESLGVTADSLRALGCGWDGEAATFPMRDSKGVVVGIRRRFPDGTKKSVTGGREGLFIPNVEKQKRVYVTEGPTDCAAVLSVGLYAIGRPSCSGGVDALKIVTHGHRVTVMADNDGPGRRGAEALAFAIGANVISPPTGIKDVRAWLKADREQMRRSLAEGER